VETLSPCEGQARDRRFGHPLATGSCLVPVRKVGASTRYVLVRPRPPPIDAALAELPPPGVAVYVHLDLDVLDPIVLPPSPCPRPVA
jgi:hypothetical protein